MEKDYNRSTYVLQDDDNKGSVQIADDVVAVIAGLAATEVKGVAAMAGNITNEIMSKVGRKNLSKGAALQAGGHRFEPCWSHQMPAWRNWQTHRT